MNEQLNEKPRIGAIALGWWSANLNADTGAARGLSARLRRACGPAEILAHRELFELSVALQMRDPVRLSVIAQTLAHISEHTPSRRLAAALGQGNPPAMSELRFQRLIRSPDLADLGTGLRRALTMVDGKCNAAALAEDLTYWGEKVRTRWCFDFFGANPPATTATEIRNENPSHGD